MNVPFFNWVKISAVLSAHSKHSYQCFALQSVDIVKSSIENPASRIYVMVSSAYSQEFLRINQLSDKLCVQFFSKLSKGLALRGNVQDLSSQKNPGKFLALTMLAEIDSVLHNHLYQPRSWNATYLSPRS